MNLRVRRLQADYEQIKKGLRDHPAIRIRGVSGAPPERYQIEYRVRSLAESAGGGVVERTEHVAEIFLTLAYPRQAPQCRMLTPVFHPNVAPHAVCIGDHWAAGESLLNLIIRVGEILAYQSYNVKSPLNGAAARWVDENSSLVPTDPRDLSVVMWSDSHEHPVDEHACQNCHQSAELIECSKGHKVCADCTVECSGCGKRFCLLCRLQPCAVCGNLLCSDCRTACSLCNKHLCKSHLKPCSVCGALGCDDCIVTCAECGKNVCVSHASQCAGCGKILCADHASECSLCHKSACAKHIATCSICGATGCTDCIFTCAECSTAVCVNHVGQCSECHAVLCPVHRRTCAICGQIFCNKDFDIASGRCLKCKRLAESPPAPSAPEMIRIRCSYCGRSFQSSRSHVGKIAKCPTCSHSFRIMPASVQQNPPPL